MLHPWRRLIGIGPALDLTLGDLSEIARQVDEGIAQLAHGTMEVLTRLFGQQAQAEAQQPIAKTSYPQGHVLCGVDQCIPTRPAALLCLTHRAFLSNNGA